MTPIHSFMKETTAVYNQQRQKWIQIVNKSATADKIVDSIEATFQKLQESQPAEMEKLAQELSHADKVSQAFWDIHPDVTKFRQTIASGTTPKQKLTLEEYKNASVDQGLRLLQANLPATDKLDSDSYMVIRRKAIRSICLYSCRLHF